MRKHDRQRKYQLSSWVCVCVGTKASAVHGMCCIQPLSRNGLELLVYPKEPGWTLCCIDTDYGFIRNSTCIVSIHLVANLSQRMLR